MGAVKLELRCPQFVGEVAIDPQPDWSFTTLLSELSSIEKRLSAVDFTKAKPREASSAAFVMRVMDDLEEESEEETHDQHLVSGRRFNCEEFYISDSDDSEEESTSGTQYHLMDRVGLVESSLSELTHECQLSVTEEIRNQILVLETDLVNENKKFASALAQVQKYMEGRLEMDRKLDMQYRRRIAEALDNHLTAVQRDHEHKSQIEERRIRDDAAIEEAKRREKTLQEEKLRQEKLRAEAEVRLEAEKKRAEEAKEAAAEAARKAAKEAAETVAAEDSASASSTAAVATKEAIRHQTDANLGILNDKSFESGPGGTSKVQQAGNIIRCAESALKLEERRAQIHKEVAAKNEALGLGSSSIHLSHGSKIQRLIKQISGTKENVRNKADELSKIFFDSSCPQSISIAMFAEKIIDLCASPNNAFFAYAHVIVLVTSQVPLAMDLLLAKLNRVCIYTVPKYINYSKSAFATKEAHHKAIGYKEDDGEIESQESYISRMESYMRLYGALVQTEVQGIQNSHGLGEGWAWLARFLNALPANLCTAVALQAFLEMAGFALHRRYKTHFKKLLRIILRDFVNALKQGGGDGKFHTVITSIQTYIESEKFLEEPEGRSLPGSLLSRVCVPESNAEQSYHQHPSSRYFYQY